MTLVHALCGERWDRGIGPLFQHDTAMKRHCLREGKCLRDGLKAFLQSSDKTPGSAHIPCDGILEMLSTGGFESLPRGDEREIGSLPAIPAKASYYDRVDW
jgi:hypothetical protein